MEITKEIYYQPTYDVYWNSNIIYVLKCIHVDNGTYTYIHTSTHITPIEFVSLTNSIPKIIKNCKMTI